MAGEQCPESGNALYGHWKRGATMRCDYCNRTLTAQNSGGGWRVPRHNTAAPQVAKLGRPCNYVGLPPGLTWKGPLGTLRSQCSCGRNVAVVAGRIAQHKAPEA